MKLNALFNILMMTVTPMIAILSSCKDNEPWDQLPTDISQFITQYFPNTSIENFSESPTTYHVRISNGPGLTFNKDCEWEAINGYGMPLPQVLLFDQLPPALYKYVEETENLNSVFSIERTSATISVVLLDSTLYYNIETQEIRGSTAQRA